MERKDMDDQTEINETFSMDYMAIVQRTPTKNSMVSLGPAPDGGWLAWAQVAAAFFCSFNGPGMMNTFGVYQQFYTTNGTILASKTESQISWIGTIASALSLIGASFFGFLIDKGYGHIMVICASILACFSFMMLSISTQYYQFILTQGVLTGTCSSILFSCALSAVAPYFSSKRGVALGIVATGSSIGGIIYSVATQRLLYTLGFGWACRITGFIILVTGVGTGVLFRPRVIPRKSHSFFATECLTRLDWMLYCFGMLFAFLGFFVFFGYYQSYAYTFNRNEPVYVYMTAILNVGSLICRLVSSYLVDRIGIFNVLIPSSLFSSVLAFCWIAARNKAGIILVGIIFGCFSSVIAVAPGIVAVQLTPKSSMDRLGITISFSFIFFGLGTLFGTPFAGIILRKYGYLGVQLYCGLSWMISCVLLLASRHVQLRGRNFWSKC